MAIPLATSCVLQMFLFSSFLSQLAGLGLLPPATAIQSVPMSLLPIQPLPPAWSTPITGPNTTWTHAGTTSMSALLPFPPVESTPPILTTPPAGLILAPSLEPLPPKLVRKITSVQFVDMKELLPDNMVVQQQEEASQGTLSVNLLPPHLKIRLREIPSPTSWAICFFDLCSCENTG